MSIKSLRATTTGWRGLSCIVGLLDIWIIRVERCGIISMMVLCNHIVVIPYHGRRSGLPNAPLDMEYDNNNTEEYPPKDQST